eukprot:6196788-Pleurochrysis_carterae.AAC.6
MQKIESNQARNHSRVEQKRGRKRKKLELSCAGLALAVRGLATGKGETHGVEVGCGMPNWPTEHS